MGRLGVRAIVDVLQGRPVPPLVDTGVKVATAENLDDPEIAALLRMPP